MKLSLRNTSRNEMCLLPVIDKQKPVTKLIPGQMIGRRMLSELTERT